MGVSVERRSGKATRQARRAPRSHRVEVRFSDEELAVLDRRCVEVGASRSAVVRTAILRGVLGSRQKVVHSPEVELLLAECRRIGINVNQIARALNMRSKYWSYYRNITTAHEAEKNLSCVKDSLDSLTEKVQDLREEFAHGMIEGLTERELESLREYWYGGE